MINLAEPAAKRLMAVSSLYACIPHVWFSFCNACPLSWWLDRAIKHAMEGAMLQMTDLQGLGGSYIGASISVLQALYDDVHGLHSIAAHD